MSRPLVLAAHLSAEDVERRYRSAKGAVERTWWPIVWLVSQGQTGAAIARSTGFSCGWVCQVVKRSNALGPDAMTDRRRTHSRRQPRALTAEQQAELLAAVQGPPPRGDRWSGRLVAEWMAERLGRPDPAPAGRGLPGAPWGQAARSAAAPRAGRRRAASGLQKKSRPIVQAVATAFPTASVELWATDSLDEHRIGLKPILQKVWCFGRTRPVAPVQQRDEWRSLVGFVHPASGRTLWHQATSVSIPLFEAELAAFAQQVGASPQEPIVRVLDRAGWHASPKLRVPAPLPLLFLPAFSPELQPAEHRWPLTNTALVNRHFASIDELEDVQAERCLALQSRPDLIRSATRFPWWPRRICKRKGPRKT